MLDGDPGDRLQLEISIAHENASGHLAQHGRKKAERSRTEREGADVPGKHQVVDAVHVSELAAAERDVIRVGIGQRGTLAGHAHRLGEHLQLQGNGEVDGLAGDGDGTLPGFEAILGNRDAIGAGGQSIEADAPLGVGHGRERRPQSLAFGDHGASGDNTSARVRDRYSKRGPR